MFDVRLFKNEDQGNRLAGGYLTVANMVKINITLMKTKTGGYFVSFPSYKKQNSEEWVNYVDAVSREARAAITNAVVEEYLKMNGESIDNRGENKRVEHLPNNDAPDKVIHAQKAVEVPTGVPF